MSDKDCSLSTLRNSFYNLKIGSENEKIWIKKLKNILESDIHQKPLGCKISNTHVKIGEVHLDTFYEAQILFSHPRWVNRFANWLHEKTVVSEDEKILIIGYETYIEPVLVALKEKVTTTEGGQSVDYCLYEEPKYIRSEVKSEQKIRYFEKFISVQKDITSYNKIVFVCGISSTLNTFIKMKGLMEELGNLQNKVSVNKDTGAKFQYYSIIHVLPKTQEVGSGKIEENKSEFEISDSKTLRWNLDEKTAILEVEGDKLIQSQYLVSVNCTWYKAQACELCFPKNPMEERPIIATSETSIIPIQMIDRDSNQLSDKESHKTYIDFFKKNRNYLYQNYLYYNHIDREDHHYKYYVRTGNLFYDIYYNYENKFKNEHDAFVENFCGDIIKRLKEEHNPTEKSSVGQDESTNNETFLDVIIAPSHFSNGLFPHVINRHVFGGKAHVIAFEPKKEYRSNFKTKFSNLEYFLEQIKVKKVDTKVKVRFHYVDDQIVTGSTFARAKSLLSSLMRGNSQILAENIIIFDQVITFVSRMSKETKNDYVSDKKNYHSFINLAVPSVRNYGDSCPSCNIRYKAQDILESAALNKVAEYWSAKHYNYRVKSLKEAKDEALKSDDKKRKRQFRRFDCENELWTKTKDCNTVEDYTIVFAKLLNGGNKYSGEHIEKAISVLKSISSPFLYYKEIIKKAALKTVVNLFNVILSEKEENISIDKKALGNQINIVFKGSEPKEKYNFINILINCLAQMESTYILDVARIEQICDLMKELSGQTNGWGNYGDDADGYYTILLNAYKRIICGIAGEQKNKRFRKEILAYITCEQKSEYKDLFKAMYLESISKGEVLEVDNKKLVPEKYSDVCDILSKQGKTTQTVCEVEQADKKSTIQSVKLYYKDDSMNCLKDEIWYIIASSDNQEIKDWYVLRKEIINNEQQLLLNEIGYCAVGDEENKYIFDLMYFTDGYQREIAQSNKSSNKAILNKPTPYVEITFCSNCDLSKKLEIIRQILAKKYALAKMLNEDIEKGSVKSAIQAGAVKKMAHENKTSNHNPDASFTNIIKNIKYLKDELDIKARYSTMENLVNMAKVIMDNMIAYSNAPMIKKKYFCEDIETDAVKSCFSFSIQTVQEDFLSKYFEYCTQRKDSLKDRIKFNKDLKEIMEQAQQIRRYPSFLQSQDIPFVAIYLIGLLETMLFNAEKHGKKGDKILISLYGEDKYKYYSIEVSNIIKENLDKNTRGMTKQFLCEFLKETSLSPDGEYDVIPFEVKMEQDNNIYKSTFIMTKIKEE